VVLQDRDAAGVPVAAEVREDDSRGNLGVLIQHGRHGVLERVEQRHGGHSNVLRRLGELEQAGDGVAAHLQAPGDLRLRQALAVQAVNLGPVVH